MPKREVQIANESGIVRDGRDRVVAAIRGRIRAEVESEFAEKFQSAGWLERIRIRGQIRREVNRRVRQVPRPSPESLYISRD
jgi:hypothetical protein